MRWSQTRDEADRLGRLSERVAQACASGRLARLRLRCGDELLVVILDERQGYRPATGQRRASITVRRIHLDEPWGPTVTFDLLDLDDVQPHGQGDVEQRRSIGA